MTVGEIYRRYPLRQNDGFIRRTLHISIPMILQSLVTSMVNLLDNIMVGQLGESAITAVAAANKFYLIGIFAIQGLIDATGVYLSQFYGAGEKERVRQCYRFSFLSSGLVSLLFISAGLLLPVQIGRFFTPDAAISGPVAAYMPLAALSFIPQIYSANAQNSMRLLGETRLPLQISFLTVFTNAFFNWIFIFGKLGAPALGVTGAALGTILARSVEYLVSLFFVGRRRFIFAGSLRQIRKVPAKLATAILRRAFPLMLNEIGFSGGEAMLFKFYGTRGSQVLAAMNIMGTTSDLFFALFSGMAVATAVIVSQTLGADDLETARSNAYRLLKLGLFLGVFFAGLMLVASFTVPLLYVVHSEVRALAGYFIRLYALFYMVYTLNSMVYFILRAGGDMRHTMLMDSGYFWLVNIPVIAGLAYFSQWSIQAMFLAGQLTDLCKCLISVPFLLRETWLKNLTKEVDASAV